jgi:hypothetical protein
MALMRMCCATADFGSLLRSFTSISRQEVLLALGVGVLILGGASVLEPLLSSLWERQNQGVSTPCVSLGQRDRLLQ